MTRAPSSQRAGWNGGVLFSELVTTSEAVAATRARTTKIATIAETVSRLAVDEVEPALAFLTGAPRQGRLGVGWATSAIEGSAVEPITTITDVDAAFAALAGAGGTGSQAARRAVLDALGVRLTAREAVFVRQLLTGEVRHGALGGIVTDAVAAAAGVDRDTMRRAAMLTGDLPGAARVALVEGAAAVAALGLRIGTGVEPMLASSAVDVAEALASTGPASVEWKFDGIRLQAHRDGSDVRLFTRNLNDITDRLPDVVGLVRALPVERIVLDGELVGAVHFFDVLHLDGADLIDRPLAERLDVMSSIDGLPTVPSVRTDDPVVASSVLDDALGNGHEGVMVKALHSSYAAGRRGAAWRKIKPVRTLDLVVLAAEWGSGRRRGWLSNLHLGALDANGSPVMVGKTFKGLTDELLSWQTARFLELETGRAGHVVHVRPELVVEIALDAAQVSTRYPGGVALRFARVRRYRDDKATRDADTLDAVRALVPGRTG